MTNALMATKPSEITVADLFCGPGGMSIGFGEHFDVSLAVDWKPDPCKTYRHNLSGVVRQRDIRNLSGSQRDFDGILGVISGPPCQPFSKMNARKDKNDSRRNLWKDFMRIVDEVSPQFFLMENVPTIFREVKEGILQMAKELGYFVNHTVLEASDFGVPQTRKRWIVVGTKKPFTFPSSTSLTTKRTVREAFSQIGENDGFGNPRAKTVERFAKVPVNKWVPISGGRFCNATRLSWDLPSPTVVNLSKVYMIHPSGERMISEVEAAVLQDFVFDYKFFGSRTSRCQQIANAAPPNLMRAIASMIKQSQFGGDAQ